MLKVYCSPIQRIQREVFTLMKNLFSLLVVSVLAFSVSVLLVQVAPTQEKTANTAKQDRWEGDVIRVSNDNSTLTVRKLNSTVERIVQYDSSTRWVSQERGSDKVTDINASQVKQGDRVIAMGTWDKDSHALHATMISKRLTPVK